MRLWFPNLSGVTRCSLRPRIAPFATVSGASGLREISEAEIIVSQVKQKFGRLGAVNQKKVTALDLYSIMRVAQRKGDYKGCLDVINHYYNYGLKLQHRELSTRLLAMSMRCQMYSEAPEWINLYHTWLEHPPQSSLIYSVMGHFIDVNEPLVVREIVKAVREDWKIRLEPPLYVLGIEAMLQLEEDPLAEAMVLYEDATQMDISLPLAVHTKLLDKLLLAFEASSEEEGDSKDMSLLQTALKIPQKLVQDGRLHGGTPAPAATLCSLAWLYWHLAKVPPEAHAGILPESCKGITDLYLQGNWQVAFGLAIEGFGNHWGFSRQLPAGFFHALEIASDDPEAASLLSQAAERFGRFYPRDAAAAVTAE